jgi:hypothetical protein
MHYFPGYDLNFKITGEVIPEPVFISTTGLLLSLGVLCLRRK